MPDLPVRPRDKQAINGLSSGGAVLCRGPGFVLKKQAIPRLEAAMVNARTLRSTAAFAAQQVGAFAIILALMWLTVHFLRLDPELLYAFPFLFILYLGGSLAWRRRRRRRGPAVRL
jgi:hypothetical protein